MTPDKIYIPNEYTDNDITPVGVTTKPVFPNDVCYIRKDSLNILDGLVTAYDNGKIRVYSELFDGTADLHFGDKVKIAIIKG